MRKPIVTAVAALACTALYATPAPATLLLESGLVGGSGDVDNVVFNPCGLGGSTGYTVQGCLNSDHGTLVDFTSTDMLLIGEGGGQATITGATDGSFTDFSLKLDDPTKGFNKLQFSLDTFDDGVGTFQAVDQYGNVFSFGPFDLKGNGLNKFTLYSNDEQVAVKFSLVSSVEVQNISDLEQVRLGPTDLTPIPIREPGSLVLLGGALLGMAVVGYRRRKRSS